MNAARAGLLAFVMTLDAMMGLMALIGVTLNAPLLGWMLLGNAAAIWGLSMGAT